MLAINGMSILHWSHEAVCNQILCQGIGEFSLVCIRIGLVYSQFISRNSNKNNNTRLTYGPLSGTTRVSRNQLADKTNLDFTEAKWNIHMKCILHVFVHYCDVKKLA